MNTHLLIFAAWCYWSIVISASIAYRFGYSRGLQDGKRLCGKS